MLEDMARGRREDAWDHTSHLLAKLHNVNCAKVSSMLHPWSFHPLRNQHQARLCSVPASASFHRSMYEALSKAE